MFRSGNPGHSRIYGMCVYMKGGEIGHDYRCITVHFFNIQIQSLVSKIIFKKTRSVERETTIAFTQDEGCSTFRITCYF